MMRRGVGDRRAKPRFEITGELGGTLDTRVVLNVRNAGLGGVLADSPIPLAVGEQHRVKLYGDGIQAPAHVTVRHVRLDEAASGESRFLIGMEFVIQTPALLEVLERWMALHGEASA